METCSSSGLKELNHYNKTADGHCPPLSWFYPAGYTSSVHDVKVRVGKVTLKVRGQLYSSLPYTQKQGSFTQR